VTRRAGLCRTSEGVRWECSMTGRRRVHRREPVDKPARGTEIVLHLREDQDDLLSGWKLRRSSASTPTTSSSPS
jgi:molecular chaperone HtpG